MGGAAMRAIVAIGVITAATMFAGCGNSGEPEEKEPMKVEDTVFAPVVTAPERAGDRANAAVELHRGNLDRRLEEDEGAPADEPPAD
jgi:hypothetical protein